MESGGPVEMGVVGGIVSVDPPGGISVVWGVLVLWLESKLLDWRSDVVSFVGGEG